MHDIDRQTEMRTDGLDTPAVVAGGRRGMSRACPDRLCRACGRRKPRFYIRGTVKSDRSHTLCFECYRALVNRTRAGRLELPDIWFLPGPPPTPAASRVDREAFAEELVLRRRRAQLAARDALDGLLGSLPPASGGLLNVS